VDRAGHKFFAGPNLSGDKHITVAGSGMSHNPEDFLHLMAAAEDVPESITRLNLRSKCYVLSF